jgi:hypothetical protein
MMAVPVFKTLRSHPFLNSKRRRKQRSFLFSLFTGMLLVTLVGIMVFSLFSKKASGMAASMPASLSTSASTGPSNMNISTAELERRLRGALWG